MRILEDFKEVFRKSNNALAQLIMINIAVFVVLNLLKVILHLSGSAPMFTKLQEFVMMSPDPSELLFKPWTLFSYGIVHMGILHILFNMIVLYWFGQIIMSYLGSQKLLNLYIYGVVAGGLMYLIGFNLVPYFQQQALGQAPLLLGASAGVLAVVVGAAVLLPEYTIHLMFLGPIKLKYIAAVYVFISIIQVIGDNSGGELAHLGGATLGYAYIRQLQHGRDLGRPLAWLFEKIKDLFSRPKIRVTHKNASYSFGTENVSGTRSRSEEKSANRIINQEEIDAILDKISEKGYDALSKEEKQMLFNASKK
ncbi:rhomboid family intramembrane serine protease [Fulvitalea axinellae]|uniref:Rhomboid family intramembrane serine protease n=1 Tax=Fulvitalea axinellae TaxID=1182444 RepID=A0AAU9CF16_9BACT|nr:rhomboid family intramembrane serine protease [Fulvitalea axinellae]